MSDLNDLIHTNATIAFNQGVMRERERIVNLIERYDITFYGDEVPTISTGDALDLIAIIKGDDK